MTKRTLSKDDFFRTLKDWIAESKEALIDIYFPHSGSGGKLHMLNEETEIGDVFKKALAEGIKYQFRELVITCFRKKAFPVRGRMDEQLAEQIRATWKPERPFYIVDLGCVYPAELASIGDGNTRKELERNLAELLRTSRNTFIGFGEHPFDVDDWAEVHDADVMETRIEVPRKF